MLATSALPRRALAILLAITVTLTLLSIPAMTARASDSSAGLARGQLYSDDAVALICQGAQQIVAGTSLVSLNINQPDFSSFVASVPAPYESPAGADLPLTTQQLVTYGAYADGKPYPQVVSCKLKSAEALEFFYGPAAVTYGNTCRDVHARLVDDVFASLTLPERERLVFSPDAVVLDADLVTPGGTEWLAPFPPDLAALDAEGRLHLQAKSLPVPRIIPPFIPVGPARKGVNYCHLAAPEYVRALLIGDVAP